MQRFDTKNFLKKVGNSYDVQFVKQVPMHPRDRLAMAAKKKEKKDVQFIKQVPLYPRHRLARAVKSKGEAL